MAGYPQDFPVPTDKGGPGAWQPIGGFGGNPGSTQDGHRQVIADVGKAPVLLVHGNGGAADVSPWDMLDLKRLLLATGYRDELIWAPSYLGPGTVDLNTPHTNNVDDVRDYLEVVCGYLDVEVVDVIAHSLGCTLMYSLFRGLTRQNSPINWDQPKKWHRVGTFVALAGAFHGLGTGSVGEWTTGGEFMTELLAETEGGGGETPFRLGKPETPPPVPHAISYFCGVASGDFVDAQNPGTGTLLGAVNKNYNLGSGLQGHQAIKESQLVFNDFSPLLNSVPPAPAATLTVDKDSGEYPSPLTVAVAVDPADLDVAVVANRLTTTFQDGYLVDDVSETISATLRDGQSIELTSMGMWQLTASASGAVDDLNRSYWVGVTAPIATIVTGADEPFSDSLLVTASTSDPAATLYYSLDGTTWNRGATVTITQDAVVSFVAIDPDGVASAVVSRAFSKRIAWDDAVSASAVDHFLAGRIDVNEYLAYSDQFGFFTPFTLYLVGGDWVLDPEHPAAAELSPERRDALAARAAAASPLIRVPPGHPQPGRVAGPVTVAIEAVGPAGDVTVHYTRDGSRPTVDSPSFTGTAPFDLAGGAHHALACWARDAAGHESYQVFAYATTR